MKWPEEMKAFVKANHKGIGPKEMTEIVNKKFGLNMTRVQMKSLYRNNRLNSGLTGRFPKGHVPACKGKKYPGKINSGCFKKGQMPIGHREVGSERISRDGYIEIKVAEPKTWRLKHRVVWEKHNGEIPEDHIVIFLDGNPLNVNIENLALVSRAVALEMNRKNLKKDNKELTELGVLVAKINVTRRKREKQNEK